MALKVHLYYWPTSFFSQKARLALEERGVAYSSTVINLMTYEQNQAWYMRLNAAGEVPTMRLGADRYVSDSDNIIDVVEKMDAPGPKLIPAPETPEGRLVSIWKDKLSSLKIESITYATMLNPEVATGKILLPAMIQKTMTKEKMRAKMDKAMADLEAIREKYPDLQAAVDAKLQKYRGRGTSFFDKALVLQQLDHLDVLFDELETQIRKSREENILEHWLCGAKFTVADILLCVLIARLLMLGHFERYIDPSKRPALMQYWRNAQTRPSVQKVLLAYWKEVSVYVFKQQLCKGFLGALGVGGVVALALFLAHKFKQ